MDGIQPRRTMITVTVEDARNRLPELLRQAGDGARITVTGPDGKALARIVPGTDPDAAAGDAEALRPAAWRALRERVRGQETSVTGPWRRDELYEDDE